MSASYRIVPFLAALGAMACAAAPAPSTGHPAPDSPGWAAAWRTDEAEILRRTEASTAAWNRGDLKGHLAIYADTVHFMTRTGPRPGVAPIEEAFTRTYFRDGKPKQQLRFEQVAIRPLDANVAIETARFVLSGGGEAEQSGWFTLVWVRTPDGWRAVHDHSA